MEISEPELIELEALADRMAILLRAVRRRTTDPGPPASNFAFHDIGGATGTSGTELAGAANLEVKGESDRDEGGVLYQQVDGGDIQIIGKFDGFTGTVEDFTGAWLGVRQSLDADTVWFQLTKHNVGRISAKYKSAVGAEIAVTQGDDATDTETYWGLTYDITLQRAVAWKAPSLAALNDIEQRELVGAATLPLSAPYFVYLGGCSHDAATLIDVDFSEVAVSSTITLTEPEPEDPGEDEEGEPIIVTTPPFGSNYDTRYAGDWVTVDAIVYGHDWTVHPNTPQPAYGGHFQHSSTDASHWPADFPGPKIKMVNVDWKEMEPTEGNYDFSPLTDQLDALASEGYDGCMLNVRALTVKQEQEDCNTGVITENASAVHAPTWMHNKPTVAENWNRQRCPNFRYTMLDFRTTAVQTPLFAFIDAMAASGVLDDSRIIAALIHGVGGHGEEFTGAQASTAEGVQAYKDVIGRWSVGYAANTYKMALITAKSDELYEYSVETIGTGMRNGGAETEIAVHGKQYDTKYGRSLDANGYSINDTSHPFHSEYRHFQGQNEVWDGSHSANPDPVDMPRAYRYAVFRYLSSGFTLMWAERGAVMNPQMLGWASMTMGNLPADASEGWCALFRTWTWQYSGRVPGVTSGEYEVNNYERFVLQRESYGATTPTIQQNWGYNAEGGNTPLASNRKVIDIARRPATSTGMGFEIDNDYLAAGNHAVVVKVMYVDTGTDSWTLDYTKSDSSAGQKSVTKENTGEVRTATFFVPDLKVASSGASFFLKGTTTDFMCVRLLKDLT